MHVSRPVQKNDIRVWYNLRLDKKNATTCGRGIATRCFLHGADPHRHAALAPLGRPLLARIWLPTLRRHARPWAGHSRLETQPNQRRGRAGHPRTKCPGVAMTRRGVGARAVGVRPRAVAAAPARAHPTHTALAPPTGVAPPASGSRRGGGGPAAGTRHGCPPFAAS